MLQQIVRVRQLAKLAEGKAVHNSFQISCSRIISKHVHELIMRLTGNFQP